MISVQDIRKLARARLEDSKVLLRANRFDGAIYLCGYAVELILKARICVTLKWTGYPTTRKEFEGLQSFKTHDLDLLLRLTGREQLIRTQHLADWSLASRWDPEDRYKPVGTATETDALSMIAAAEVLLKKL